MPRSRARFIDVFSFRFNFAVLLCYIFLPYIFLLLFFFSLWEPFHASVLLRNSPTRWCPCPRSSLSTFLQEATRFRYFPPPYTHTDPSPPRWAWQNTHLTRHIPEPQRLTEARTTVRISPRSGKPRKRPARPRISLTDKLSNLHVLLRVKSFER